MSQFGGNGGSATGGARIGGGFGSDKPRSRAAGGRGGFPLEAYWHKLWDQFPARSQPLLKAVRLGFCLFESEARL